MGELSMGTKSTKISIPLKHIQFKVISYIKSNKSTVKSL